MPVFAKTVLGKTAAGALLLAALAMAGCGGDAGGGDSGTEATSTPSFEDAMVQYASCMRENGVDMPDPQFSGDGSSGGAMTFAIPLGAADGSGPGGAAIGGPAGGPVDETFKAAAEACQPIMEAVRQNMPKLSPEEEAKMRDDALKFAQCMREHGVDMPDPTFDGGRGSAMVIQGASQAPDAFDPDKFNEASSACSAEGLAGGFRIATNVDGEGTAGGFKVSSGASK
jgi:hypothetical protein